VNIAPARKTAASAVSHLYPSNCTTVYATNAFSPMYGAIAKGRFAYRPMINVPIIAVITVATIEGPSGMPAVFRIAGLIAMMYDIVTNVVTPASTSRLTVVPACSSAKKLAIRRFIPDATFPYSSDYLGSTRVRGRNACEGEIWYINEPIASVNYAQPRRSTILTARRE